VFFIHDVVPLMFENNRYLLGKYIELYNQADLLILPSQNMADFLYKEGLNVHQYVVQRMWDCPLSVNTSVIPRFNKLIQFAGQTDGFKFSFVQRWKYESVRLAVTASEGDWEHGENIEFLGWFQDQNLLANTMRRNGGFGLLWTEDEYCKEYMTLNACSKLSLYLASGIPVIVHNSIPEADTIFQKNLGLVVDSLDEAVEKIEKMTKDQYDQMVQNVASFGRLLRGGFFTRKVLTDALFQLLYN
jgi:glycosyltransferase involved in cell wall biosynthesis